MSDAETDADQVLIAKLIALEYKTKKPGQITFWVFAALFFSRHLLNSLVVSDAIALATIYAFPAFVVYGWCYTMSVRIKKSGISSVRNISSFTLEQMTRLAVILNITYPFFVASIAIVLLYVIYSLLTGHASVY